MPGIKPRSSARTAGSLIHSAISLALLLVFYFFRSKYYSSDLNQKLRLVSTHSTRHREIRAQ